jgi:cell wall-associated NlpC family hydrolase
VTATLGGKVSAATGIVVAAAVLHATGGGLRLPSALAADSPGHSGAAARQAIRYARAQLGKPYIWAGTGPGGYDCSGLTQQAFASAGIQIPRVAAGQFSQGHQVPLSQLARGDEVFFAGADGTPSQPGHVGLVLSVHPNRMIEAYAPGYPIRVSSFGTPSSPQGDRVPVGATDPAGG